ncbi:MAG: hypothetical protein WCW64_00330 [Phycisphaerae bacterium]|jgi:hypothetical protein
MKENCRKVLLVFAAVCFVLAATNIMLALHLAEHDNDKGHNPETCPICQQAIANKTKVILPTISIAFELPQITIANIDVVEPIVKNFKFITPYLRAPPAAA